MGKLDVNKRLIPMKAHYFFFNAGNAPVVPFMSVYAKQLGFSSVIVGIIYTVLPFSGMLVKPLVGAFADRYRCQRKVFLSALFITALTYLAVVFLPGVPAHAKIQFLYSDATLKMCDEAVDSCAVLRLQKDVERMTCNVSCPFHCAEPFTTEIVMRTVRQIGKCIHFEVANISDLECHANTTIACDIQCDSHIVNEILNESAVSDKDVYKLPAFWLLLGVYLLSWLGQAVTVSVSDTICFQILENHPTRYGYQRMYGSLGWGIFSIASGFLVDIFSKGRVAKNYTPVFCIGVGILLVCMVVSSQIQYKQRKLSAHILSDIGHLFCHLRFFIFVLWCISMGLCTSLVWNFLFWLLEELAASNGCTTQTWIKTVEGLAMGIQCLAGELPFFFLSDSILKRIGHVHTMSLVLFVVGIRFILYSVLTNPWYCLPIELLNGITFGLFYATMASYASIVAPPGVETTTQGLVGAIFEGVGVSTGSFIGGILFQTYGGSRTFRMYGVCACVVAVLHALVQYLMGKPTDVKDPMSKYSAPQDAILTQQSN